MEAETRREKVRKVGGRGMKSAGKAQDKRERKNKPALAGRIPKKIGNRQNLPGKRPEDCQKRKTVNGGIRRTKNGREAGPGDRKIREPGWKGKIRNGRNRKVETEKKEKNNFPAEDAKSGEAGRRGRRGDGEEEKRRGCRSGADGVEKRVLKL